MKKVLLLLFYSILLVASDLTLEIVKEVGTKPTVVIEDATVSVDGRIDGKLFKLLVGDLEVSAHFTVDHMKNLANFSDRVDYLKYKGKDFLIRYRLYYDDFGKLNLESDIYNLKSGIKLFHKNYRISDNDRFAFLAHHLIYDFNKAVGFDDVSFLKSFVVFSKYTAPKRADIVISDYTLTYQKTVVHGGLNLFPKWADKEHRSFYYTQIKDKPTLYLVDIYNGTRQKILSSEGMLVCSDVSEDGRKLLLTMAPNMQPDIYLYDKFTKNLRRITRYPGIDVNGNFVENEQKVVFVSDRLGYPTIFAKKIGSRAVHRVVYHGRNNSACSTFGDYVVYSSRESDNAFGPNTFNLYLVSTTSDYIRRLTANGVNIFPRFAPDGETILFIKEYGRQSGLGVIRLKYNKSYLYPLNVGKIQSIDW